MLYWLIYDIASNKIRSRVASKCKDYGLGRVQKSVFLGEISRNKAEMLAMEVEEILGENDCVFVIPACNECFKGKIIYGEFDEEKARDKDFEIIE